MSANRPLRVIFLASEWKSSKGGLSTLNRELAIQFAKRPNVLVTFFVPKCSETDKKVAGNHNVRILEAEELPCYDEAYLLAFPPRDLVIDFVVGHGVVLGKHVQIIRNSHNCKWLQVVHTAPDELAMYKNYPDAIPKGEEKQWNELRLCERADLVAAVRPKLTESYTAQLSSCGKEVYNLTPGIFTELSSSKLSTQKSKFRILVFGRGDCEDFQLKGFDIAAQAVAKLNDHSYHLTFVGAREGSETQVANWLLEQGLSRRQLTVYRYHDRERLPKLLCAANLVIIPSRTEGFGLAALEALSAGLPFLVSQNSGFGEAIQELPFGSSFIVDSEDPECWAAAIKNVRQKGNERANQECQGLRTRYAEMFSWGRQCYDLVQLMLGFVDGKCFLNIFYKTFVSAKCSWFSFLVE